jgi:hypothetical protein
MSCIQVLYQKKIERYLGYALTPKPINQNRVKLRSQPVEYQKLNLHLQVDGLHLSGL